MNRSINLCAAAVAAMLAVPLLAALTASLAHAPGSSDTLTGTETVSVAGLDLATADGVAALHRRIRFAAIRICRVDHSGLVDDYSDAFSGCVARTVRNTDTWSAARIAGAGAAGIVRLARDVASSR